MGAALSWASSAVLEGPVAPLSAALRQRCGFWGRGALSLTARTAVMGGVLGGMLVREGYRVFKPAGRVVHIVMIMVY